MAVSDQKRTRLRRRNSTAFFCSIFSFGLVAVAWADETMMGTPMDRVDREVEVMELPPTTEPAAPATTDASGNVTITSTSAPTVPPQLQRRKVHRVFFRRRFYTSPSAGFSSISYKEGTVSYSAISLTGKISTRYPLTPRWDFGGSGYLTLMPLKQTPSDSAARFLGLNVRIGYSPSSIHRPWRLSLLTGLYYTRMFVSNNAFGFKDMVGPQLFPVLMRMLSNGNSIMGYLKYSPVTNNLALLSLSNREMALGLTFAHVLTSGRTLTYSLDYANLSLDIEGIQTATNSVTVSIGTSL